MALAQELSHVYPLASRVNERGRLEIGGCDTLDLAAEFGTPAYVIAEDDIRARARAFLSAFAATGQEDFDVLYASKALPISAVYRLLAEEGLACDVASGGELHLALRAGFDPARVYLHGNAKDDAELAMAIDAGVGQIVIDSFDEIDRLDRLVSGRQRVLVRVAPGVRPSTHDFIATGQQDTKFGFSLEDAPAAIARVQEAGHLELVGLHMHIGSQTLEVGPFRAAIEALAPLGDFPVYNLGGGLGVAYTAADAPPSIEEYVEAKVSAAREFLGDGKRLLIEPGRSLVANACVTLYSVVSVKRNVSTYVAVNGGMSDNLRPMLYGAVYEAEVADRIGGGTACRLAGKHCESADIIVRDADLNDPRPGDIVVTPATGAYGYAMANNYNGVPRPPVIFCKDGNARVVVRRETYDDLAARDVSSPEPFRIGLLGHGTVGSAFAQLLPERAAEVEAITGLRPEITAVLTRSRGDFEDVLAGSDLVVELIGGIDPARDYVLRAMRAGKHVVTANKQLLSQHGEELWQEARAHNVQLRFEAAVAGVVPVIRVLQESLAAAHIDRVHGIVNGTTNFILSEMARTGASYEEALAQAQELGYAEADPSEDVNGKDAAAKMAILARLAFNTPVHIDQVRYEGIEHITSDDMEYARELGLGLKLIGTAERIGGGLSVRVHPAFLYGGHPLASISGPFNAVTVESSAITEITMSGPGAGGPQTASAVLGDVISAMIPPASTPETTERLEIVADVESAFYLHLEVADRPGVLAQIAEILGLQGASIKSVVQKGLGENARLVMVVHPILESRFEAACELIGRLDFLRSKPRAIRVLEEEFV